MLIFTVFRKIDKQGPVYGSYLGNHQTMLIFYLQNVSIDAVAESGPGLVFIVYPQALSMLPLAQFWNALFFLMIVFLGFDCLVRIRFILS